MKAIGLDIGTTSICGILLDVRSGEVLSSITVENDSFIASQNSWEKIQWGNSLWNDDYCFVTFGIDCVI